jgi:hypothetical protein
MELKAVLSTYAGMISFGLCAGVFASAVYIIVYNLWYPVFNLVNSPDSISRLILDLFIAGMHMFFMFALVPLLAGALFIIAFYKRASISKLIIANTLVTIAMGVVFYALTTFIMSPHSFDMLATYLANLSAPLTREMIFDNYMIPMMTQVVEFIVWSSAGAFIAYLMIYRSLLNPKNYSLRHTGVIGLLLLSLVAIAPPAITYVVTII